MSIQRGNLYSKMLILRYGIAVYGFTQIRDNETHSNITASESFYKLSELKCSDSASYYTAFWR